MRYGRLMFFALILCLFALAIPAMAEPDMQIIVPEDLTLTVGRSTYAGAVTVPDGPVRYQSDKPKVAKITKTGRVTALKPGTATITAASKARPEISATYQVTVRANERLWDRPDPQTLAEGVQFAPKRLRFSGKSLLCEMYVFNKTQATVKVLDNMAVSLTLSEGATGEYYRYLRKLSLKKALAPGAEGTYVFRVPKSYRFRIPEDRVVGKMELPTAELTPRVLEKLA